MLLSRDRARLHFPFLLDRGDRTPSGRELDKSRFLSSYLSGLQYRFWLCSQSHHQGGQQLLLLSLTC